MRKRATTEGEGSLDFFIAFLIPWSSSFLHCRDEASRVKEPRFLYKVASSSFALKPMRESMKAESAKFVQSSRTCARGWEEQAAWIQ